MLKSSLKLQLALGAMALALALLVFQSVAQFQVMRHELTRQIEAEQTTHVTEMAHMLDEKLDERVAALAQAALALGGSPVQPKALDTLEALLRREAALLTLYDDLYIFDAKGVLLVDWPVKPGRRMLDMSARDYIQGVVGTREPYVSRPILGKATQQPIVVVAAPILDAAGGLQGIMGGVLNLYKPNLLGALPSRKNGETGHFYLVAPDRTLIVHPDKTRILKPAGRPGDNPLLDQALQGFEGTLSLDDGGPDDRLETFKRMQNNGWTLAAVLPASEAFAPISQLRFRLIAFTSLLLLVCLPLLWIFAARLLRPLNGLVNAMQGAAQQIRPGVEVEAVSVAGANEIRTVSHAFNEFLLARNQAETRLATSEQRLALLVEHVSDGIWDWEPDTDHLYVNPAMRHMLGLGPTDTVTIDELDRRVHPADIDHVRAERMACLSGEQHQFENEYRFRGAHGPWIWVHGSGLVVGRQTNGSARRLLGTIVNVSSRKEQIEKLAQAKADAEAASLAKSHFLANMSHEIRTPMNGVIGMTHLCLQTELTPMQRDYLNMVESSARSLMGVIDDILDFSKIEAQKLELQRQVLSLPELLRSTARNLSLRAAEKRLELVLDLPTDLPDQVLGDEGRLRQVLTNLLGNAIKFTADGEVVVRVLHRPDLSPDAERVGIEVQVIDTGIGIEPDKLAVVFDAFTQADATTTRRFGGTGLGLAISRSLVGLMGGQIQARSTPDQGSVFSFTLVLELALPPASPTRQRPLFDTPTVVLVVEDNTSQARVLARLLEQENAVPRVFESPELALAADWPQPPALMLVDAGTPVSSVVSCLVQAWPARTGQPVAPMVLVGNLLDEKSAVWQELSAVCGFVLKPLDHEDLAEGLRRALAPVQDPSSAAPALPPSEMAAPATRPLHILVAEDNVVNQKLVTALLTRMGHQVAVVPHGADAVAQSDRVAFDLILMDIQMPIMGGLEATAQIRSREKQQGRQRTPIVALTANALKGDRENFLAADMDGYVAKPISVAALAAEIAQVCRPPLSH